MCLDKSYDDLYERGGGGLKVIKTSMSALQLNGSKKSGSRTPYSESKRVMRIHNRIHIRQHMKGS